MNKRRSTKRALLMSALSLMMCMTMFIGSTFAWFTDSVTSAGNKIVAGNLKVDLIHAYYPDNTGSAIKTSLKENPAHKIFDYDLWEPGYTQVEYFQIINKGNLHFQYEMRFTAQGALTALADVIEVYGGYPTAAYDKERNEALKNMQYLGTVADIIAKGGKLFQGNTDGFELEMDEPVLAYAIALHMKEEAGNDYQGLSLFEGEAGFNVTLLATQMENEFDSFGNDYDRFADYDGEISGAASLEAALVKGGTYKVTSDIALDETVIVPAGVTVALDLSGNALTGNVELADGSDATIVNGTIKNEDSAVSGIQNNGGNLTLNDVEIESARHAVRVEGGTVTIDGGVYKASGTKGLTQHALNVSDGATVTINGGTFVGPKGTDSDSGAAVNTQAGSTVIINGGNFSGGKNNTLASNGTLSVYGGTFDQDPSKYVAEGYEVIKNADGTYTVSKKVVPEGTAPVKEGLYVDTEGVYYITKAAGFDHMREMVAGEKAYEKDGTWILYNDIDLKGVNWTPIAGFHGIFDGNDKTISNMNASFLAENTIGGTDYGVVCTIKDVTFHKATITGTEGVGVVVSNGVGVTIENVKVTESTVIGTKYVGGIVGVVNKAVSTITGCSVTDSNIKAEGENANGKVGGIVGFLSVGKATGNTVTGCTISGPECVGGIAGRGGSGDGPATIYGNTVSDNTVTGTDTTTVDKQIGDKLNVKESE